MSFFHPRHFPLCAVTIALGSLHIDSWNVKAPDEVDTRDSMKSGVDRLLREKAPLVTAALSHPSTDSCSDRDFPQWHTVSSRII